MSKTKVYSYWIFWTSHLITNQLFKHVVHENVEDGSSMIKFPLVIEVRQPTFWCQFNNFCVACMINFSKYPKIKLSLKVPWIMPLILITSVSKEMIYIILYVFYIFIYAVIHIWNLTLYLTSLKQTWEKPVRGHFSEKCGHFL